MPSNHPCFSFSSFNVLVQLFLFLLLLPAFNFQPTSPLIRLLDQTLVIGLAEISFEELLVLRKCLFNYWFFATAATKLYFRNQWESVGGAEDRLRSFNRPRSIAVKPSDSNQVINPVRKPQKMSFGQICDSCQFHLTSLSFPCQ